MVQNCNHCKDLVLERDSKIRMYLKQRAIILRYGCLCSAQYKYWPVKAIAIALDMSYRYVN